jgi:hypothetical protein
VLLTAGIYRCCGIRKFRCAGTTIATLVHSGVDCVLVRGVCTTLPSQVLCET